MTIRKLTPTETETLTGTGTGEGGGTLALPPAGLPSRNPTKSYWLKDPSPALLRHRGTAELPATADVVVVGSGITGAFAARELMMAMGEGAEVVMLEAREVCWGATGRVSSFFLFLVPWVVG